LISCAESPAFFLGAPRLLFVDGFLVDGLFVDGLIDDPYFNGRIVHVYSVHTG